MADLWCRKIPAFSAYALAGRGSVLIPEEGISEEALAKLPEGVTLRVRASQARNARYHRFYWAMLGKIQKNLPEGVNLDVEALHEVVKMGAGLVYNVRLPDGTFYQLPRSISFNAMDETAFREFMDAAIPFITSKLIPGMSSEVLENEVYSFLGGGS